MASASTSIPNGASVPGGLSPAQRLMAQEHAVDEHQPSVEEIVDEEDVAHPPPSAALSTADDPPLPQSNGPTLSAKAAGKQRAQDPAQPEPVATTEKSKTNAPPDTMSEEAFPSLGGSKASSAPKAPLAWSTRPSAVNRGGPITNGTAGRSSNASSITSNTFQTPAFTPLQLPRQQKIPGRETDVFRLPVSQLKSGQDLKKPIGDTLREFNRKSKAKVEMTTGDGFVIFTGQAGTKEAASQAIREIVSQITSKHTETITVPVSVRPHIIGRNGATITGINKRTGAKVNFPNKATSGPRELEDGVDVDLEIEGDPIAVAYARREIDAIVNERSAGTSLRMKGIPAELFPFIVGPHNSRKNALEQENNVRLQVPQYHTWDARPPPQETTDNTPTAFEPHPAHSILISGDRLAALQAKAEIERQVAELQRQLIVRQLAGIERARHQFVLGNRGASLHDFLEETGCSVILPPHSHDSEVIHVVGPPHQIPGAIDKINNLAYSMASSSVDIAGQHQHAPLGRSTHARNITNYLQHKKVVEELERTHNASIFIPKSGDRTDWDVYSRENMNLPRARTEILNLISGLPPSRMQPVQVDPFYQAHLREHHAHVVRDQYGVHIVFPASEEAEVQQLLLVYESASPASEFQLPRRQPTAAEAAQFTRALQEAEQYIQNLVGQGGDVVTRSHDVPVKFREKFNKFATREANDSTAGQIPVQLLDRDNPHLNGNSGRSDTYPVRFRGPAATAEAFAAKIAAFLEEQARDEAERGYITTAEFPAKFNNVLIGKRGEHINKLRDEYDVDIQANDGLVEIKGPKAKADSARQYIVSLGRKLEDETLYTLKIDSRFHRDLIGKQGGQVIRLQDRYGVRINFPRYSPSPADGQSIADGVSDAGTTSRARAAQGPDDVIIKGPKKGADGARSELLDLYQYIQDNSFTTTISVAQSQLPSLIGSGGKELENLRLQTGAKIDIPGSRETIDPSGRVDVKLKGTKASVDAAKKLLEQRVKLFDNTITRNVDIEKKHHQSLIGRGGDNIRKIITDAGAIAEDPRELARYVQFPKADAAESVIVVEGDKGIVDKIVASLQQFVQQRENQVTETVDVPPERHGALIGRGGTVRKQLESEYKVTINIPGISTTNSRSAVRLTGLPSDVAKAKEKITSMLRTQEGETIVVPQHLHYVIADGEGGRFFRNLSRNLKVAVDHGGQPKPPRPDVPPAPPALITDEPDTHFHIVEPTGPSEDAPTIPWILKGSDPESVAKAKQMVLAALADARDSCTGFLTLAEPKDNRHVIGSGGSTVNRIRKETGCQINVPKADAGNDAIEIRGRREAVERAHQLILEAVDEASRHGRK